MKKIILSIVGGLSFGIGAVGVFLPVLPTTPFVLLSAICFSISNKKFHDRLIRSRVFGEFIRNYRENSGVRKIVKIRAIIFLWLSLIIGAILVDSLVVRIILGVVAVGVTAHIALLRTAKPKENAVEDEKSVEESEGNSD